MSNTDAHAADPETGEVLPSAYSAGSEGDSELPDYQSPDYEPRIPKEFLIERQGKKFVLYAGLLNEAHRQGLKEITTTLIQIPTAENGMTAISYAVVVTDRGRFTGIGDASPTNLPKTEKIDMTKFTITMSETRAKARALRDAVNVGLASAEELDDADVRQESHRRTSQIQERRQQDHARSRPMTPGGAGSAANRRANAASPVPKKPEYCPECKEYNRERRESQREPGRWGWVCKVGGAKHTVAKVEQETPVA